MANASSTGAQQASKLRNVEMLFFGSSGNDQATREWSALFRERLRELGYVEGKTILVNEHYAEGDTGRLNKLARELAASKVDVIVAQAVAATTAARQATDTIPIVMVHAGNEAALAAAGLIASLARPGGNVTGSTNLPLGGKHVELIREIVPRVATLAILANPTNAGTPAFIDSAKRSAAAHNVSVVVMEVTQPTAFPQAFTAMRAARPGGLLVAWEPMIGTQSARLIEFTARERLPSISDFGSMARRGGLIAYAALYREHYPLAADYVDKILKGAKPGNLAVQQPAKFELVINLKTAKAIGITIPQSLLLRADEVIQ
jgi:putative ABC transport system substrate-binding protein